MRTPPRGQAAGGGGAPLCSASARAAAALAVLALLLGACSAEGTRCHARVTGLTISPSRVMPEARVTLHGAVRVSCKTAGGATAAAPPLRLNLTCADSLSGQRTQLLLSTAAGAPAPRRFSLVLGPLATQARGAHYVTCAVKEASALAPGLSPPSGGGGDGGVMLQGSTGNAAFTVPGAAACPAAGQYLNSRAACAECVSRRSPFATKRGHARCYPPVASHRTSRSCSPPLAQWLFSLPCSNQPSRCCCLIIDCWNLSKWSALPLLKTRGIQKRVASVGFPSMVFLYQHSLYSMRSRAGAAGVRAQPWRQEDRHMHRLERSDSLHPAADKELGGAVSERRIVQDELPAAGG